jgi:hypothetical protein
MTMGANPLLSDMPLAPRANLEKLYGDLVDHTSATIYLMQYHLSVPSSALLNREIASVAEEVDPSRQRLIAIGPPQFEGPPWVIGGDTGIHPSAAGYARMAATVPSPR